MSAQHAQDTLTAGATEPQGRVHGGEASMEFIELAISAEKTRTLQRVPPGTLARLIGTRLEARQRRAAAAQQAKLAATAHFNRCADRLIQEIHKVDQAYGGILTVRHPEMMPGGYGITIKRAAGLCDPSAAQQAAAAGALLLDPGDVTECSIEDPPTLRLVMVSEAVPSLVRFIGGLTSSVYDLAVTDSYTGAAGFVRGYQALLEDLAAWAVDANRSYA